MQVNNIVNARYDTPYHIRASVEKDAGILKIGGDTYSPNETAENQRSKETVGYQAFQKAWMPQRAEAARGYAGSADSNVSANPTEQAGAVSIADTEDAGEFLGLTMVPEEGKSVTYGVRAKLSDKSTPGNPIVQVVSNLGGKKVIYNVEVNKVNPNNATQLEMFALLSYTDKMGITDGGTFGSYQRLRVYGENASSIGYCNRLSGAEAFLNERFDWTSMMEKMIQAYQEAEIDKQAKNCKELVDFFSMYTEKIENKAETALDCSQSAPISQILVRQVGTKIKEIFAKIQNGGTEPTYQIGSQSFTEKEWEELLDKFDSVEEAIRNLMKEEQARREAEEAKKEHVAIHDVSTLLTTESTSCVYRTANPNDNDLRYITWYTEEGIFCRKEGETKGCEWSITFENKEQYDKVMEFIGQFPFDWNLRFAAHENFWKDFLNDAIDMEGFMEFINGTNKGIPDFSITVGDSMYVDKDKMQWAKYMNPLDARFYTAEEMHRIQMKLIAANKEKLKK